MNNLLGYPNLIKLIFSYLDQYDKIRFISTSTTAHYYKKLLKHNKYIDLINDSNKINLIKKLLKKRDRKCYVFNYQKYVDKIEGSRDTFKYFNNYCKEYQCNCSEVSYSLHFSD